MSVNHLAQNWQRAHADILHAELCLRSLSFKRASSLTGVHPNEIERWITGSHRPSPADLQDVLDTLGILLERFQGLPEHDEFVKVRTLASSWSPSHGERLAELLADRGLDQRTTKLGVSTASLARWVDGSVRPRVLQLSPVLGNLGVGADSFTTVVSAPRELNSFASALRALKESLRLTSRGFAAHLGVNPASCQAWMDGRGFPVPSERPRINAILGIDVDTVRKESKLATTDTRSFPPLGLLVFEARAARGLDREEAASLVGSDSASLRAWETGVRHPDCESLRKLADGFELDYVAVADVAFGPFPLPETFGRRLRRIRCQRLLSTLEVAAHLGIHTNLVSRIEIDESFPGQRLDRLDALAALFGVTVEDFLEPDPQPFARWLLGARAARAASAQALGVVVGVSASDILDWESARTRPTIIQAARLGQHLVGDKVLARSFLTGEDTANYKFRH